ncbi:hypothetical protein AVI51_06800 [Piscirickettsia salmonis]|uniref:Uncharacterized protein n=1 Tax=Piscirickettsia salmonis TaxID=1238 RepID=A0A9Q5VG63_PISSA|nr:hypothetical protein [Piscirickettsia salmonis]ALA25785.1 ankryin [Piscirickettsia salmonis]APS43268.1 hypothetical protein AVI48_01995 [Piscirickettsia salmonis]APS46617.1 hypothetical protein AVI49_02600 [Piscirickettsia salmonis]APS50594.1 hypothetical protein AVI50_06875 [Piscirickettsia salmonis]APS53797.1 hypothetical protein AVI51_06800 [Piscirickettsia salmonis]
MNITKDQVTPDALRSIAVYDSIREGSMQEHFSAQRICKEGYATVDIFFDAAKREENPTFIFHEHCNTIKGGSAELALELA